MKLKVPRFDGTKPLGWIFKINQFFEYHGTLENERLTIASFYREGKALAWFQWMTGNGQFTLWPVFLQALQTRFAPSQYEDPTRALFKLTQRGLVTQYLSEFEDLASRRRSSWTSITHRGRVFPRPQSLRHPLDHPLRDLWPSHPYYPLLVVRPRRL